MGYFMMELMFKRISDHLQINIEQVSELSIQQGILGMQSMLLLL